ncbi:MAG TPA: carbohydrate kinase [Solirubrobacteraceae bacterium]|nr:carbohydrate kinase [Solirubrobacteraceae bacterium]
MIVVSGEALIDLIPAASGDLHISVGGGPFNTARWLGRLGQPTSFMGAISHDPLGQRIRDSLSDCGVSLDLVVDAPHPTTLALIQLDALGAAQYSFYTHGTSVRDLTVHAVHDHAPAQIDVLHVGGVGMTLQPSAGAVEALVEHAHAGGALIMLDPNVRPSLISDRREYIDRFKRVLALTHVLKLSLEDLAWIVPGQEPHVAARVLHKRGPHAVLLTEGAAGATVYRDEDATRIPPRPINLVDTIGAGDAFSAGFLTHWRRRGWGREDLTNQAKLTEAASFAASVAGVACSQKGATPPLELDDELRLG